MKGRPIRYAPDEIAWMRAHGALPAGEMHAAFCARFRRDVAKENLVALRKRLGVATGRDGRFRAGHESWNAGMTGYCPPGSEKGWFRPGERRGVATRLYQPIGTERIDKNGYRQRKVNDGPALHRRWRHVHLIEWEALNGPVPKGMALKCLDGDRTNTAPQNWTPVPRALLPRLAGGRHGRTPYDAAPDDVKPALLLVAKLEHAVRTRRSDGAAP